MEQTVPSVWNALSIPCCVSVPKGSSSRKFFLSLGRPDAPMPSGHAKQEEVNLSSPVKQKALVEEVVTDLSSGGWGRVRWKGTQC